MMGESTWASIDNLENPRADEEDDILIYTYQEIEMGVHDRAKLKMKPHRILTWGKLVTVSMSIAI